MPVPQNSILLSAFITLVSILHPTMDQLEPVQILTSSTVLFASASTTSPIAQLRVVNEPDMNITTVARYFSQNGCVSTISLVHFVIG